MVSVWYVVLWRVCVCAVYYDGSNSVTIPVIQSLLTGDRTRNVPSLPGLYLDDVDSDELARLWLVSKAPGLLASRECSDAIFRAPPPRQIFLYFDFIRTISYRAKVARWGSWSRSSTQPPPWPTCALSSKPVWFLTYGSFLRWIRCLPTRPRLHTAISQYRHCCANNKLSAFGA